MLARNPIAYPIDIDHMSLTVSNVDGARHDLASRSNAHKFFLPFVFFSIFPFYPFLSSPFYIVTKVSRSKKRGSLVIRTEITRLIRDVIYERADTRTLSHPSSSCTHPPWQLATYLGLIKEIMARSALNVGGR